jgi:hypothetical protein
MKVAILRAVQTLFVIDNYPGARGDRPTSYASLNTRDRSRTRRNRCSIARCNTRSNTGSGLRENLLDGLDLRAGVGRMLKNDLYGLNHSLIPVFNRYGDAAVRSP